MRFHVLTLFPDMVCQALSYSIIGRAQQAGIVEIHAVDIRDFSCNKHHRVDDYPYGGGNGLVMEPGPVYGAYESLAAPPGTRVVFLTPQGRPFCQEMAKEFSQEEELIVLCGHYEGVDERVIEEIVTDEVSLGDFVLTGGELGAIVLIDAVSRLLPGVLKGPESYEEESFTGNALEYPQYTRPPEFRGRKVPEVLLSGHHEKVAQWRREQSLIRTYEKRPDLYEKIALTSKERQFMEEYLKNKHQ